MFKLDDRKLWGNEAADDEDPEILDTYFVRLPVFDTFFDPEVKLAIARARKGMGKSALIKECEHLHSRQGKAVVVSLKGADLVGQRPVEPLSTDAHIYDWQQRICSCINHHLGAEVGFAFNDDQMLLVENAELAGFRRRNLISSLVARLKGRLGPLELQQIEARDHERLLRRITDEQDWQIWLLIDDVDSTFVNQSQECRRIATFFSACRDLASSFRGINIRTCIRTDVWATMRTSDESLDKCEQYIFDIHWSNREFGRLLSDRISSYRRRSGLDGDVEPLDPAAPSHTEFPELENVFAPKFPWGRTRVPPHRAIHALAAGRPRWAMQLCRMAGAEATRAGADKIKFGHIKQALEIYGQRRLDDLIREHQHQCPQISQITLAFSRCESQTNNTSQLLAFIRQGLLDRIEVEIDGSREDEPLRVAHFLFRVGFLVGLKQDGRGKHYYRYEDKPELLRSFANPDDGMDWQIQQAFLAALGLRT